MGMEHVWTGMRPRAVLFDLLTGLIDSWTLWASVAGGRDGRRWREIYLRKTYAEAAYRPYEDLVREPEASIRRLLEHCLLPFEPACLAFHEDQGKLPRQGGVESLAERGQLGSAA